MGLAWLPLAGLASAYSAGTNLGEKDNGRINKRINRRSRAMPAVMCTLELNPAHGPSLGGAFAPWGALCLLLAPPRDTAPRGSHLLVYAPRISHKKWGKVQSFQTYVFHKATNNTKIYVTSGQAHSLREGKLNFWSSINSCGFPITANPVFCWKFRGKSVICRLLW